MSTSPEDAEASSSRVDPIISAIGAGRTPCLPAGLTQMRTGDTTNRVAGCTPQAAGPHERFPLDVDTLVRESFAEMAWDPETARPTVERLRTLGLAGLVEAVAR